MVRQSLAALREPVHTVPRHATHHTWGHIFSPMDSFLRVVDIPEQFHSLPFLPPCLLSIHAFKGPFAVPCSALNAAQVGILVQLLGEHQLDATSTTGSVVFPPFPTGSVSELLTALLTRFTLRFHATSPHTQSVLF